VDTDINYGIEDLHLFTQKMVTSMLQSSFLHTQNKPYIALGEIKIHNGVNESIDTELIQNLIRSNLLKSNKVHFIDNEHIKELEKEISYQGNNEYINPSSQKKMGQFIARDYTLTGDIHAIKKDGHTIMDYSYILSLRLTDIKTSSIVWAEEKEIRKQIIK